MMNGVTFGERLINWYEINKRTLPWREVRDPYKIWLSEVILQQTRVVQGLPYYQQFLKTFPTVFDLAKASIQQVLRLWQGLGYYSRARNLHLCAQYVVTARKGKFPDTFEELIKMKGIGPYTAAAIASFAFKEKVAVVDGNVYRVLSRVFGMELDIASLASKAIFFQKATDLMCNHPPDLFNQAIMEFGALLCLPKNPNCEDCIFTKECIANQRGIQKILPIKTRQLKIKKRYFYYFNIRYQDTLLLKERTEKDIWQGLYDFYLIEKKRAHRLESLLDEINLVGMYNDRVPFTQSGVIKHALSHQQIIARFIELTLHQKTIFQALANQLNMKIISKNELEKLPKPILVERYLNAQKTAKN